ncbi:hypothetical protein AS850_00845 [Frondihabitans sp. 762G35]|uniref:hypothetical protein n=1 Tax=Frondihabitans sp. 762G35 TaxID=1446794 RepID=UPI000D21684A|nr:hypothetical protein [Frondihabitans sp. 762G35]ARC55620.1 hypothetical protein AS850_00845 [Frondihabitans sp. 762G35]
MAAVESYVFVLPWPPLVSLETYHQLDRVRERMVFRHDGTFTGRLELSSVDGAARAWAEVVDPARPLSEGDDDPEKTRSRFEGSVRRSSATTGDWSPDDILNLEQDMEFYLCTLAQVMAAAAPFLERSWAETVVRWSDRPGTGPAAADAEQVALPVELDTAGLIPLPITLEAENADDLRATFVATAFEAISPWRRS